MHEPRAIISPSRYVQGAGAIHQLGRYLSPIGSTPLVVADDLVWGLVGHDVEHALESAGLSFTRETFNGITTEGEINRIVDAIKRTGADVAVAIGGGSAIDTVKAAGHLAGIRWANCPTVASTDAPCSALSVLYTEAGEFHEYRFLPRNPDLVLVDSQIVANAPVSLLIAGVGDALATWIEARATSRSNSQTMAGGPPTLAATALAELSWNILWENTLPAIDAVRDNQVTPAVEKVIEANTLLSGIGFESGGVAAAHAIHNGLTGVPETHGLAHGEKVNIGSIAQLMLEGAPTSDIRDFIEFTTRIGLPTTLTEIGLRSDDRDSLKRVSDAATVPSETIHSMPFDVNSGDVLSALISLERFAVRVRTDAKLPEPKFYVAH